eukprot:2522476-Lingulodinium_polyedra.AAC.1
MSAVCQQPPRSFGNTGWAWHEAIRSGQVIGGFAWCNGQSSASQTERLQMHEPDSQWWPCIIALPSFGSSWE